MSTQILGSILERIVSKDKDHRYMAVSDLQSELRKPEFRTDDSTERRLCKAVLQQLDESSGDISGLAIKCLGLLACRLQKDNVETLLQDLCTKLSTGKEHQRDLASIGLKTVVADVPGPPLATTVVKSITPHLIAGIRKQEDADVASMSLDITNDLVSKFGNQMPGDLAAVAEAVIPQLDSSKSSIRKRAIHCLGAVAAYLPEDVLDRLAEHLLNRLATQGLKFESAQTYMHCLGAVSRSVSWRFGRYLDTAVPLAVQYCQGAEEGQDELQEYCLQALEAFTLQCPAAARAHFTTIFPLALECLRYDPNYTEDMEQSGSEEEDADELTDEDYSDDEDASWKVRRAAAKLVAGVIVSQPELLPTIYPQASQALVARFREREENVKADIFSAFVDLVHMVGSHAGRSDAGNAAGAQLRSDAGSILKAAARQLREKSPKTRSGIFLALRELVLVLPECCTAETMSLLLPAILQSLTDKASGSAALKLQTLQFLQLALKCGRAPAWQPHMAQLLPPLLACARERYYKVSAEALRMCTAAVPVLRPRPPAPLDPALQAMVPGLLSVVEEKLAAQDQDQEVKEAAINCAGSTIAYLGDVKPSTTSTLVQMLVARLRNDITRLTAVKALESVATAPVPVPLGPVLQPVLTHLTSFLRKANRPLRQASLSSIDALMTRHGDAAGQQQVQGLVEEVVALISDADLVVAAMSLHLCCTLLQRHPACASDLSASALPPSMALLQSQLLQGAALQELQAFLVGLLQSSAISFDQLLSSLLTAGQMPATGKTAQHATAQCIASLCAAAGYERTMATVTSLLSSLEGSQHQGEAAQRLALLTVGEVGRTADLSAFPPLKGALTRALSSSSEDIKGCASLALGAVCIGNLTAYLPFLLQAIQDQAAVPKDQYLLLKALNEALVSLSAQPPGGTTLGVQDQQQVLALLLQASETGEEECANVVAECLGHLALLAPANVLPILQENAASQSAARRAVIVFAVKFMVVDKPHPIDGLLHEAMAGFLSRLTDADWHVRRAAVQALSAAAHNKAELIADMVQGALPALYAQTVVDQSLVRMVDLGPFKLKVDDGLELRKSAFEAMDVLLDTCRSRLAIDAFLQPLRDGLKDHYDVKMPCHLLLGKLAAVAPAHVMGALEDLIPPLTATLTARPKADAVKQEVDRNEDMLRSCLRAIEAVARIPNVDTCAPFTTLMTSTVLQGNLQPKYAAIKAERAEADGLDATAAEW
ncbi:hypothetical protein WJX73_009717 [Symbiochloris irregularis]|uniref:TATA-binding protein interacting (TIP20) domain-containing protein n=1 Tax=Symbiochloris irregularis TaxID=706552 RepID=A0AAW1NZP6_9CHLO